MTGLPALLGALGLVGLGFALVSFVLALLGMPSDLGWIWVNFGIGIVLVVTAVALNFDTLRERMSSGEARRAGRHGSSALLTTVLSIAILGMIGFLTTRYHWRYDLTEGKVHSLSDQTRKELDGLERDVQVLALFPKLEQQPLRQLLDRYEYVSDRFTVEYADPTERPDLLQRYEIDPEQLGEGLLRVGYGDQSTEIQEATEENITNAMVKLTRTSERTVYFLEGHNERAIEGERAAEKEGFGRAADALRNENYRIEKLLLAARGDVPDDADVVIVAGATRPLLDTERAALQRYLEGGGALFVLVDPRANTNLVEDVRGWGVELGEDIVVDRQLALFGRATTPFASRYDEGHEITRDLRETTLFHAVRSVRRDAAIGAQFTEIVFTADSSWAERDLETFFGEGRAELGDGDLAGPVPIAVAGTPAVSSNGEEAVGLEDEPGEDDAAEDSRPRLVVFGDSDFASNELIEAYRNRDLFINTTNWLLGDVEAISIRPQRSRASRFAPSQEQFARIRSLSLFVLPEVIAVLGVITWWTRRQAPGH